ncbi:MAG TPA: hypothetical protein VGG39_24535 [Polyangiaceae bacterium]|jgi:hypothetical protein
MQLELTQHDVALLLRHLERHIQHLETELVPTDARELQVTLAREIAALEALCERLKADPQESLPDVD